MTDAPQEWRVAAVVKPTNPPLKLVTSEEFEEFMQYIPSVIIKHDAATQAFDLTWRVHAPDDLQTIATQALSYIITAFAAVFQQAPVLMELHVTRKTENAG